jgi:PPOX class probable F420-dependent enzyme
MPTPPILSREQRAFLAAARRAVLATIGSGELPRLVPICFVVAPEPSDDGDSDAVRLHSPIDEKPKASRDPLMLARVRDILRRPDATLLVDHWSEDWSRLGWLRLDCRAEVLVPSGSGEADRAERDAAIRALREKYPQYATHRLEDRPILRLTVERAVSWGEVGGADAGGADAGGPDARPGDAHPARTGVSGRDGPPARADGGSGSSSSPGGSRRR